MMFKLAHQRENFPYLGHSFSLSALGVMDWASFGMNYSV